MIILPASPAPNGASPAVIDFGFELRPATGAAVSRINRPGNRLKIDFSFPPMTPDDARLFVSRLMRAKAEGLRMEYPLLDQSQGLPGNPVVNGTDSAGTTLKLRALTPNYTIKEGYWLTLIDAAGTHYLHNVAALVTAAAGGTAILTVEPPLRFLPPDGAAVLLAKPLVEGLVTSVTGWDLGVDLLVRVAGFTLEERK